ncbi:MAG: divergent polysaccharide deacetylase family protein [Magnetospirillum sp.]|nr:divergent polysaccharide deacetylase family protein [Magnetospirillum sp.]
MLTLDEDDFVRPVGAPTPTGRSAFSVRQVLTVVVVLALGGGLGAAAYFLSSVDLRDIIGFLDVDDPGRAKLALALPGAQPSQPTSAGELLTPPGGLAKPPADKGTPADSAPVAAAQPPGQMPPRTAAPAPAIAAPLAMAAAPPPSDRPAGPPPSYAALPPLPQGKPLAPAPVQDLLAKSANGDLLPVVAADGRQPWRVYSRPFAGASDAPKVAVVIADLGLDREGTEAAITRLPPDVSLAFSPYAPDLAAWIRKARGVGHEVLVVLPVARDGASDPGPLGLSATAAQQDNIAHLEKILAAAPGAVGVVAPPSAFTGSGQLAPVLAALRQRGLLYVGAGTAGAQAPAATAISLVVDRDPWREAIDQRLAAALKAAKSPQPVVLLASASPLTLDRLGSWIGGLAGEGAVAAPVSSVVSPAGKP